MLMISCCRDIQKKYNLTLTRDAVQQFTHAANNSGLCRSIFTQAQYHVLRRLKTYWVPRYLLHKEYLNELRFVNATLGYCHNLLLKH